MAGPGTTTDVLVLMKRPPAESFQSLSLYSAEHGVLTAFQRIPKKAASATILLDLFDEAAVVLESSNEGRTWFVKEARLLMRRVELGRSYDTLRFATQLTTLAARNPLPEEGRPRVLALLRDALAAFSAGGRPDIVYLKSLYRFARDEGYPLKEHWFPTLPAAEREQAAEVLNRPVAGQALPEAAVERLQRRLDEYLRGNTEILLD